MESAHCDGCVSAHAHAAVVAGATPQETAEAIGVTFLMNGGPGTVYGAWAFAAFNEFYAEQTGRRRPAATMTISTHVRRHSATRLLSRHCRSSAPEVRSWCRGHSCDTAPTTRSASPEWARIPVLRAASRRNGRGIRHQLCWGRDFATDRRRGHGTAAARLRDGPFDVEQAGLDLRQAEVLGQGVAERWLASQPSTVLGRPEGS